MRKTLCHSCKHRVESTGSCGQLIIGKRIKHKGKKVRLCGCITDEKAVLKSEHCDIGKW